MMKGILRSIMINVEAAFENFSLSLSFYYASTLIRVVVLISKIVIGTTNY